MPIVTNGPGPTFVRACGRRPTWPLCSATQMASARPAVVEPAPAGTAVQYTPSRGKVRISRCWSPLSPTAVRAALIRVVSVDSDTRAPTPNRLQHILLTDDAVAIDNEVLQKIKDLGLERNNIASPA